MKKVIQLAVLASTMISSLHAAPLVIYGNDDRHEVYEATEANQLLAKSTAILIHKKEITRDAAKPGVAQLTQTTLRDWIESSSEEEVKSRKLFSEEVQKAARDNITFCDGTRFTEQPNPGMCSGFLIAPDLIVTAGHCVAIPDFCKDYQWVFDFEVDKTTKKAGVDVKEENIYKCEKVVSNNLISVLGLDYGVVKLNRRVKGRTPLKINSDKVIDVTSKVTVIGGPSGLPTKVAPNGSVRKNTHPYFFVTNLDTFQGNSGSAVFNSASGTVEGILVRGEEDYVPDYTKLCIKANECKEDECRGEDVSRMTSIPEVAVQSELYAAATSGNLTKLSSLLSLKIWVDFYTQDGQSALIKASGAAQNGSIKALLAKNADVKLSDAKGNTALHELAKVLNAENADALGTLVEAGVVIEAKNDLGQTALLAAGTAVNVESVKLLIKAGADKNAVDAKGENVLFAFLRAGKEAAVVELSNLGVDIKPVMAIATTKQKIKLKLLRVVKS